MGFKKIEEIEVWKRGCRLAVTVYEATKAGELSKDYALRDQIRKAVVSIPSNIAEGFERETNKEFIRFLYIARGSCGELRTQVYIAQSLEYLTKDVAVKIVEECKEISSMLTGLINYLTKAESYKNK